MPWRKGNRLRLVTEFEAGPETRQIFDEVKQALGLPGLSLVYPALAIYPKFLKLHWEMIRNVAASQELLAAAGRLRADAYTRTHSYFRVPNLDLKKLKANVDGEASELAGIAEFFYYQEPLLLLLLCFQMQALEGPTGAPGAATLHEPPPLPPVRPQLIGEQDAGPALKKRYEEIRRTLQVPYVNPEFCAFARFPEFLEPYWETLKQMIASPLYDECLYGVRDTAWSLTSQLPGPAELTLDQLAEAGCTEEEISSVARILELFVRNLSAQLLNISAAKIGLEGGNILSARAGAVARQSTRPAA